MIKVSADSVGDVPDEAIQVRAVDRRIAESVPGPVPVRILASPANAHHGTGPAGRAEAGPAKLLSGDHGVQQGLVKGVRPDGQAGTRRAVIRALQRIGPLYR